MRGRFGEDEPAFRRFPGQEAALLDPVSLVFPGDGAEGGIGLPRGHDEEGDAPEGIDPVKRSELSQTNAQRDQDF